MNWLKKHPAVLTGVQNVGGVFAGTIAPAAQCAGCAVVAGAQLGQNEEANARMARHSKAAQAGCASTCKSGVSKPWYRGKPTLTGSDWMGQVPDDTNVKKMFLPGTHDTACDKGGAFSECQNWTFLQQLQSGIRVFDIRATIDGDKLHCWHGITDCESYFDDYAADCEKFLAEHPTEAIFLNVRTAGCPPATNPAGHDYHTLAQSKTSLPFVHDTTTWPNLGDVRGRLVIWGGNCFTGWGEATTQDKYNLGCADEKVKCIFEHSPAGKDFGEKINVNFTSAGGSNGYDYITPSGIAFQVNEVLYKRVDELGPGLYIMDYPGVGLIEKFVSKNPLIAPVALAQGEADYVDADPCIPIIECFTGSDEYDANYDSVFAFDGTYTSRWAMRNASIDDNSWIQARFMKSYELESFNFMQRLDDPGSSVKDIELSFSDGSFQRFELKQQAELQTFFVQPVITTFVRVTLLSAHSGACHGATVIDFFGKEAPVKVISAIHSSCHPGYEGINAFNAGLVDGPGHAWASLGAVGVGQWVEAKFDRAYRIQSFDFLQRPYPGKLSQIELIFSDGSSQRYGVEDSEDEQTVTGLEPVVTTSIKVLITAVLPGENFGVVKLEFFGEPAVIPVSSAEASSAYLSKFQAINAFNRKRKDFGPSFCSNAGRSRWPLVKAVFPYAHEVYSFDFMHPAKWKADEFMLTFDDTTTQTFPVTAVDGGASEIQRFNIKPVVTSSVTCTIKGAPEPTEAGLASAPTTLTFHGSAMAIPVASCSASTEQEGFLAGNALNPHMTDDSVGSWAATAEDGQPWFNCKFPRSYNVSGLGFMQRKRPHLAFELRVEFKCADYQVGDKVRALYNDADQYWFDATVTEARGDGTYNLAWADGDTALTEVTTDMVRRVHCITLPESSEMQYIEMPSVTTDEVRLTVANIYDGCIYRGAVQIQYYGSSGDARFDRVIQSFRTWDKNKDGRMDVEEMKALLVAIGVPAGEVPELFAAADTDADGFVNYSEFAAWLFADDALAGKITG